ncbi:MAG: triose-phosphate isomerase [Pseudomonadota bacterium]
MTEPKRKPIIIGNWKMNKTVAESLELATAIKNAMGGLGQLEVGIAPPFGALWAVAKRIEESKLILAAQNCHFESSGAYTGEISAAMLADIGCSHVILGHSERRQFFAEDDALINKKLKSVLAQKLTPVLCVGEQLAEREAGRTFEVTERQLVGSLDGIGKEQAAGLVLAYEPVWAIGTGKVATTAQAQEVHVFLRNKLRDLFGDTANEIRIQYGGSVKPDNIRGLMTQPDIDGALVGGASLTADNFVAILRYNRQH